MRLFLKEHVLLILVQCLQFSFFLLLLGLSGFRNYAIMLYAILVGFTFLLVYLLFHYYTRRHVYSKLSSRVRTVDELIVRNLAILRTVCNPFFMRSVSSRILEESGSSKFCAVSSITDKGVFI